MKKDTRGLPERDAVIERWLHEEVVAVYEAMKRDPARGIPASVAFSAIRTRHAKRAKEIRSREVWRY
jgi:antitoxin ParD1/3/4